MARDDAYRCAFCGKTMAAEDQDDKRKHRPYCTRFASVTAGFRQQGASVVATARGEVGGMLRVSEQAATPESAAQALGECVQSVARDLVDGWDFSLGGLL